jgi:hypothetical protein
MLAFVQLSNLSMASVMAHDEKTASPQRTMVEMMEPIAGLEKEKGWENVKISTRKSNQNISCAILKLRIPEKHTFGMVGVRSGARRLIRCSTNMRPDLAQIATDFLDGMQDVLPLVVGDRARAAGHPR